MKNLIIAALVAVIAIGGSVSVFAASQTVETTAAVEVTVWKHVASESIYLSTRPADGAWTTHNTAIGLSTLHPQFPSWYQGSAVTVSVPVSVTVEVPDPPPAATAEPDPEPFGGWIYFEDEDLEGSYAGYFLTGRKTDGDFGQEPNLVVNCVDSGLGSIFITTGESISGDSDGNVMVRYRFSGGTLMEEMWFSTEGITSLVGIVADTNFHRELRSSTGSLFIEITPSDGRTIHFTFDDVTGAGDVFDWYRDSCPN